MKKILILISIFILGIALCSEAPFQGENKQYKTKETIEISGTISSGIYLSRSPASDFEFRNESFLLNLDLPVEIIDVEDNSKSYKDITNIEIENVWSFDIHNNQYKEVKIKGTLDIFIPQGTGYYRQYSTPVYITIISLEVINESKDY